MIEEWKDIPEWEGIYQASSFGQIRSFHRGVRILKQTMGDKSGHLKVGLHRNRYVLTVKTHRLILLAFIGPCPDGLMGCHNNGNPIDNRIENLRWDTQVSNMKDQQDHGNNVNLNKTHCKWNHEFTEANTYINKKTGSRNCRECHRIQVNKANAAKREEAKWSKI